MVVLVGVLAIGVAVWPGAAGATQGTEAAIEADLLALVNETRAAHGVASLQLDEGAPGRARSVAVGMRDDGALRHTSTTTLAGWYMPRSTTAAETIARTREPTADAVLAAWMASDHHRRLLLDARFSHVGFGAAVGGDGTLWAAGNLLALPAPPPEPDPEPEADPALAPEPAPQPASGEDGGGAVAAVAAAPPPPPPDAGPADLARDPDEHLADVAPAVTVAALLTANAGVTGARHLPAAAGSDRGDVHAPGATAVDDGGGPADPLLAGVVPAGLLGLGVGAVSGWRRRRDPRGGRSRSG